MFKLHLKERLVERGIKFPYKTLLNLKIGRESAKQMLKGEVLQIRFDHLYKLCIFLNCTPKELIKYHPASSLLHNDQSPLAEWRYQPDIALAEELLQLTPIELEQMNQFLKEIKGKTN